MDRNIIYYLLCLIFMFCLCSCDNLGNNTEKYASRGEYVINDNISNLRINDIAQDGAGYIWIATARGLNRYNGYVYAHYFKSSSDSLSLSDDLVNKLLVTKEGELWVVSRFSIDVYNSVSNNFTKVITDYGSRYIQGLCEDKIGNLWTATNSGLYKIDKKSRKAQKIIANSLKPEIDISDIVCDSDQTLKLFIDEWRITLNTSTCQFVKDSLYNTIHALHAIKGTNSKKINASTKWRIRAFNTPEHAAVINSIIGADRCLWIDSSDDGELLFIHSSNSKLYVYQRKTKSIIRQLDIPANTKINKIFFDNSKNIWVGTFDNGFIFSPDNISDFDEKRDLSRHFKGEFVTSITSNNNNLYWIATRTEGLFQFDESNNTKSLVYVDQDKAGNSLGARCCLFDSQNRLWVGTKNRVRCYKLVKNKLSLLHEWTNLREANSFMEDSNSNIWITFSEAGIKVVLADSGDRLKMVNPFINLKNNVNVTNVIELREGGYLFTEHGKNLFIADSIGGMCREAPGVSRLSPQFASTLLTIFQDSRHKIWIGSYSNGVAVIDNDSCRILTIADGLPSNDILAIKEDKNGRIWLSTSYGISQLSNENTFINYFEQDGLQGNQYHEKAVYIDGDGVFFFGGNHGITSFIPENIYEIHNPTPLIIEKFKVLNTPIDYDFRSRDCKIVLPRDRNTFAVDFVGLDYHSPQKLRYRHKLEGYDKDWSTPNNYLTLNYTNIPPGRYTLLIDVSNCDGFWSKEPKKIIIVIRQSVWLILIYIVIYTLIALILISWFIHICMIRERELLKKRSKYLIGWVGKEAYKSYKDEANVDDTYLDGSTYIKEPLLNEQRVQGMFPGSEWISENIRGDISEFDIELLDKLHAKIDKQISNPKLNVDDLAESMNFSRSTFYRKMRNITGISPKDYLRIYRVRKSVELIETGKYQIAEIADMTGFNTHSHFSMTFKNIMGCSPKEYKNSL